MIFINDNTSAIILAGGASARLGQDKRRLRLWGERGPTLLEHTVSIASMLCPEVLVVLNDPAGWPELPARLVHDEQPGAGPLAGLAAGLRQCSSELALVLAADLPLLNPALLRLLLESSVFSHGPGAAMRPAESLDATPARTPAPVDLAGSAQLAARVDPLLADTGAPVPAAPTAAQARPAGYDALVPRNQDRLEPLLALYRRSCLQRADLLLAQGRRSLHALLDTLALAELPERVWRSQDRNGLSFINLNTPQELALVRQLLS